MKLTSGQRLSRRAVYALRIKEFGLDPLERKFVNILGGEMGRRDPRAL